jgi:PilZ domain-containing protein
MDTHGRATTRLRYRFPSLVQARAHLHGGEGRPLFFYRDEKLRLLPYAPVCLEFKFDDGTPSRALHGEVLDSLEGSGTWIEVLDTRAVTSLAEYTRAARRLGCDLAVELRTEDRIETGRLLDLSHGGARVNGVALVNPGQPVELRLLSPDRLTFRDLSFGNVAWSQGSELGVRFDPADAIGRAAVSRLVKETEASWRRAWESVHPRFCCKRAGVVEPEPPRLRRADDVTDKIAL